MPDRRPPPSPEIKRRPPPQPMIEEDPPSPEPEIGRDDARARPEPEIDDRGAPGGRERKFKRDVPYDEAMRVERPERIVRPKPNTHHDPSDPRDQGPHVERVGLVSPDD